MALVYLQRVEEKQYNNSVIVGQPGLNLSYKIRFGESVTSPLVYLVHGRAGNFDVMWTFARSIPKNCTIIAPQANIEESILPHSPDGKSWWLINPIKDINPDCTDAAGLLTKFISQVEERYSLSPQVRISIGFSQGAAVLSCIIQSKPDLFSAVGLLAGFVVKMSNKSIADLPQILIVHGIKDEIVPVSQAQSGYDFLQEIGYPVELHLDQVGHKVGTAGMQVLQKWLVKVLSKSPVHCNSIGQA